MPERRRSSEAEHKLCKGAILTLAEDSTWEWNEFPRTVEPSSLSHNAWTRSKKIPVLLHVVYINFVKHESKHVDLMFS